MRVPLILALLSLSTCVIGCEPEDETSTQSVSVGDGRGGGPSAGAGGVILGGAGRSGSSGRSGSGGGAGDGGTPDADDPVAIWCDDVDPAPRDTADPNPDGEIGNGVNVPADLEVTRAEAVWEAGCADPTLRITLSGGRCSRSDGHELQLWIPAAGIENGTVVIGQNVIMAEPAAGYIRARYTRPVRRFSDDGVWGTCAGANGTLDVIGAIELLSGRRLQASFMLELTRCDGGSGSSRIVDGTFDVIVPASLRDICPG